MPSSQPEKTSAASATTRWTDCLGPDAPPRIGRGERVLVGLFPGDGVGPEVTAAALSVLEAALETGGKADGGHPHPLEIRRGGPIGREAEKAGLPCLPEEAVSFCEGIFGDGGVILNGPGGSRYVYELRHRLELYFKISPLRSAIGLASASRFKPEALNGHDLLIARENCEGVYQGEWEDPAEDEAAASHRFRYSKAGTQRFLQAAAKLAAQRRGELTVAWKESGVPSISRLWQHLAEAAAEEHGVSCRMVDIDFLAYSLVQEPRTFDVIAAPNLFGDVLADLGASLLGSRGVSFSGNYGPGGLSVYQTNHGSAYDLAGTDRANPAGQILSVAMLLRESFGLAEEAQRIEAAVRHVWDSGARTADLAEEGTRTLGTRAMGEEVAAQVRASAQQRSPSPTLQPHS